MNRIIQPYRGFGSLDEAMRAPMLSEDHIVDMFADIVVRDKYSNLVEKKRFRCESFVGNFMYWLNACLGPRLDTYMRSVNNVQDLIAATAVNCGKMSSIGADIAMVQGPVIGTGTAAPTINDYRLEEQITNGSGGRDLSLITDTADGVNSSTTWVYVTPTPSWVTTVYRRHFVRFTSAGVLQNQEFLIHNSGTYNLDFYTTSPYWGRLELPADCKNYDFTIKSYGSMTYASPLQFTGVAEVADPMSQIVITRTFTNGSGEDFDGVENPKISEFGLMFTDQWSGHTSYATGFLIARDVQDPGIVILAGNEMTLTYTIQVTTV